MLRKAQIAAWKQARISVLNEIAWFIEENNKCPIDYIDALIEDTKKGPEFSDLFQINCLSEGDNKNEL